MENRNQDITEATIGLIDSLKATTTYYGLANNGSEYKIITDPFSPMRKQIFSKITSNFHKQLNERQFNTFFCQESRNISRIYYIFSKKVRNRMRKLNPIKNPYHRYL